MHLRDCSCATILQVFSAASDGAIAEREINNRMFSSILTQFEGQRRQFVVSSVGGAIRFANLR